MLERKVREQAAELKILRQECSSLGKKPHAPDPKAEKELQAAVRLFIQQKRERTIPPEVKPSLKDRRAFDRDNIAAVIREHKHFLVGTNSIMRAALRGKEKCGFRRAPALGAFTDGFRVDSTLFKDTLGL